MAFTFLKKCKGTKNTVIPKLLASERVLNTYELREAVLAHLSPADLRKARLVCRTWPRDYEEISAAQQSVEEDEKFTTFSYCFWASKE